MLRSFGHVIRLLRAFWVLSRYGVLVPPEEFPTLPILLRVALALPKIGFRPLVATEQDRLVSALSRLGPSYIKLGQFLATRADLIGPKRAFTLREVQDRLPAFAQHTAQDLLVEKFGGNWRSIFIEFSPAIAAASIAQVHRAKLQTGEEVAVKLLRPGIEKRFAQDLESFAFAARMIERLSPNMRRLRPVAAVEVLQHSMKQELDLRMEAAALSEMAYNSRNDADLRIPKIYWSLTSRNVLTTQWVDALPLSDISVLKERNIDLKKLSTVVVRSFLRHAIRDGFFHADMHQGNLFVDAQNCLIIVDFGIMGRLNEKERLFLARILYGFITRDYDLVSRVHFEAGYVPIDQDHHAFSQALRAIGEPIMDKNSRDISMVRLLTQLFEVTNQFNMVTQPQLLLLQKTMVVVEGVARTLDAEFNMWKTSEPIIRNWIERKIGPEGVIENIGLSLKALGAFAMEFPDILEKLRRNSHISGKGFNNREVTLDQASICKLARAQAREARLFRLVISAGSIALIILAIKIMSG